VIAAALLLVFPFMKRGSYHQRVVIPASVAIALTGFYWTLVRVVDGTNF
jgi:hypothetical protein